MQAEFQRRFCCTLACISLHSNCGMSPLGLLCCSFIAFSCCLVSLQFSTRLISSPSAAVIGPTSVNTCCRVCASALLGVTPPSVAASHRSCLSMLLEMMSVAICRPPAATTASQPVVLLWDMLIKTDKADWMQLQSGCLSLSGSGMDADCICCTDCTSQAGKGCPQAESAS